MSLVHSAELIRLLDEKSKHNGWYISIDGECDWGIAAARLL